MKALLGLIGGLGALYFISQAKAKTANIPKPHEPPIPKPHEIPHAPVTIPPGWRLLSESEMTPELISVEKDVSDAGFATGSLNRFDLNNKHYAVMVRENNMVWMLTQA